MASEIVVGLDVGTTKVLALVGEVQPGGGVDIIGMGQSACCGLKKGAVVNVDETVRAIESAISRAQESSKVEIGHVTLGVTGEHISSENARGAVSITGPAKEIREADRQRALEECRLSVEPDQRQILHSIPRRYSVDGHAGVVRPVGMSGAVLEVETHVVTASRNLLDNILRCVARAGLRVDEDGVVLESVATAEAVLTAEERELGVAVLDIGGGITDMAVFSQGSLAHTAVIPVGGEHVTSDLTIGLCLSREEAERLKLSQCAAMTEMLPEAELVEINQVDGESKQLPMRILGEIVEPRMEELFTLVKEEMAKSGCEGRIPAGLVLTGGASQLPGAAALAERVMNARVRLGVPRGVGGMASEVAHPAFATAVGLVQLAALRHAGASEEPADEHLLRGTSRMLGGMFGGMFRRKRGKS